MTLSLPLRFSFLFLVLLSVSSASAQTAPPAAPQIQTGPIDRNGAFILMRNTLIALDQANKTNEYAVFRSIASAAFQVNTTGRLSEIFAAQRREGLNLAFVAILEPRWTVEPQIEATGMIHMAGVFEVNPVPVVFDLLFTQQNGQWLLFGLSVALAQPTPQAAAPAAPAKAAETKPAAKPGAPAPKPVAPPKPAAAAAPAAVPAPKPATP